MDYRQRFVKSLRVPDRPYSAAFTNNRKIKRDQELINSLIASKWGEEEGGKSLEKH